jgi:cytochrome c oxidase subunit 1/cytochrome c oxidase subunit I+III
VFSRLASVDHKVIGLRYLGTALGFLLLGGLEAMVMRWQLAGPQRTALSPEAYSQLFTMHGVTMIFWYAAPVLSGFSNYLFPLVLGTRDMAFPRLNALSYWLFLASGLLLYSGFLIGQGPNAGWFSYVPLAGSAFTPGLHQDFYSLSLILLSISTTVGAINFIVTALRLRAPGMRLFRMPLLCWGTLTASVSALLAMPPLGVACAFLFLDRRMGTHFFDAALGGNPLLWQHLFWIFGHPWVYIVVLPAMSMISMIIPTFCRRPIVGYRAIVFATIATVAIGSGVWMHHMFATGLSPFALDFFSAASMAVTVPSAITIFAWLATIHAARTVRLTTAMLFSLGFLVLFTLGGVSGVMTGAASFDWQLTDTYFVVAHLHYVLLGINLFPVVAAVYYWFPKFSGRMLNERLGMVSFWVMFGGMNLTFFPMHVTGLRGMPRRIYTYQTGLGWDALNLLSTIGAGLFALGIALVIINLWHSRRRGAPAGNNPWEASSLEWATTSPPPAHNFAVLPAGEGREQGPALAEGEVQLTTALEGEPEMVARMPGPSLVPLVTALATLVCFAGLVAGSLLVSGAGFVALLISLLVWTWPKGSLLVERGSQT